jgi:hypothetical protein
VKLQLSFWQVRLSLDLAAIAPLTVMNGVVHHEK